MASTTIITLYKALIALLILMASVGNATEIVCEMHLMPFSIAPRSPSNEVSMRIEVPELPSGFSFSLFRDDDSEGYDGIVVLDNLVVPEVTRKGQAYEDLPKSSQENIDRDAWERIYQVKHQRQREVKASFQADWPEGIYFFYIIGNKGAISVKQYVKIKFKIVRGKWTQVSIPKESHILSMSAIEEDRQIALGTDKGLWYSSKNEWVLDKDGLPSGHVLYIKHSIDSKHLYAVVRTEGTCLWRRDESGDKWRLLHRNPKFVSKARPPWIAFSPYVPGLICAKLGDQLLISQDNGESWDTKHCQWNLHDALFVKSSRPMLYAGCFGGSVMKSEDLGITWVNIESSPSYSIKFLPFGTNGLSFYVQTAERLMCTEDGGKSWFSPHGLRSISMDRSVVELGENDTVYGIEGGRARRYYPAITDYLDISSGLPQRKPVKPVSLICIDSKDQTEWLAYESELYTRKRN